jgi:serine/threonine protein kinase
MIHRLQVFHDHGYLHRDLKPESICIGSGKKAGIVHLIDFSLVKRYVCNNTGHHLKHLPNKGVVGTKRFLSLNAHVGNE